MWPMWSKSPSARGATCSRIRASKRTSGRPPIAYPASDEGKRCRQITSRLGSREFWIRSTHAVAGARDNVAEVERAAQGIELVTADAVHGQSEPAVAAL